MHITEDFLVIVLIHKLTQYKEIQFWGVLGFYLFCFIF